jgi:hypothetical protein
MSMPSASVITLPLPSTVIGSRKPNSPGTFADVAAQIEADESLTPRRRRDMVSALATMVRALRRDMSDVPAHPGFIREQLKGFHPSMLTPTVHIARWRNVQSLVSAALKHVDISTTPGRYRASLPPEWEMLLGGLSNKKRFDLSKMAQFCTAEGITPEAVDDEVMARFHAHLKQTLINKSPREIHRTACKVWNRAADETSGWPQRRLKVPDYTKRYAVPRGQFPASFNAEFDGYIARLGSNDLLDDDGDFRPLRPLSLKTRVLEVHQFASALVHRGRDPQTISSLADLVELNAFKEGLRFFYEQRTPGKYLQAHRMAVILTPIAKYWVKVPPEHLAKLQAICQRLDTKPKGMTEKNRKMLAQFDEANGLEAFLGLTKVITKEVSWAEEQAAKGKTPRSKYTGRNVSTPRQRSLLVQTAVAIETLTMAPLRIANLGSVKMGVHLIPFGDTYRLQFEEREVKNEQRLGPVLPAESARLVRTYIQRHRRHLVDGPSPYLFPGTVDGHKNLNALSRQISAAAKEYAGITLTAHTFRHIAAKLYLTEHPGDYGTVKVFLGHKNIQTTIDIYCESEQPAAFARYDEHVLKLRGQNRDGKSDSAEPKKKER